MTTPWRHVAVATGKRCGSCWPPATARVAKVSATNQLKALI
jgi:hypothetical protein